MFWRFNLLTSHIDTILDKLDVTLHEVMDEGDVLQECKSQNRKLIDFLVRPENLEELVNMVTQEPADDMDEKLKYKFPNTACELLTSDVHEITDKLAADEALLNKIYAFLESDAPLNPLLASFFSKVMGLLITRKSQLMVDFLRGKEDFVGQLLHHLGTSAVMDLLLRLITCIDSAECRIICVNWLNDQQLVLKLVQMIDPAHPDEKHCNAAQSLCDIIRLSRDQMSQHQDKADPDPLLTAVESQETIAELLTHMLEGEKNESVIVSGLSVIQTLLEFKKMGVDFFRTEGSADQLTALDNERLALAVNKTVSAIVPRLRDLHHLLLEPPKQHYFVMPTTIGPLDPPLGNSRLQTARLIATLLLNNTNSINDELHRLGTIQVLMELYFKYSWNNFLHTQVELCLAAILSTVPCEAEVEGDEADLTLIQQLLIDYKLIQRVLDAWEDNEQQQARPGGHRKGYMGHLTKIANHLTDSAEKGNNSERLKKCIQEMPEETREKWETFISGTLAEMNKQNTVDLVGNHPLHSSSEDDDPDFRDIPFPQDSAMQQRQPMTSNFIDQFGFNEEEFVEQQERADAPFADRISSINFDINTAEDNPNSASLFEQACNDRIHQFDDDNGSDEELWEEKELFSYTQGDTGRPSSGVASRRGGGEAVPAVGTGADSDGSTDSEEELDSPKRILPMPSTTENMDIDSSTGTPTQSTNAWVQTSMPVPVAMDTASPWETQQPSSTTENEENWAKFDDQSANPDSAPTSTSTADNWADFSNFSSLNSTDPSQGSPPVAMDTADSSVMTLGDRAAAYMVSSSPADLCSEVSSVDTTPGGASSEVAPSSAEATPTSVKTTPISFNGSPSAKTTNEPMTSNGAPAEMTAHGESISNSDGVSSSTDAHSSGSGSPPPVPDTPPPILGSPPRSPPPSPPLEEDDTDDTLQDAAEDDDLSDNFNFLAASGLMRGSDLVKSDKADNSEMSSPDSLEETDDRSEQVKLEDARAEAKAALEQFAAAAGGASNGPV